MGEGGGSPGELPRGVDAVAGALVEQIHQGQYQPLVREYGLTLVKAIPLLGSVACERIAPSFTAVCRSMKTCMAWYVFTPP